MFLYLFLFLLFALPLFQVVIFKYFNKEKTRPFFISLFSALIIYAFIMISVVIIDNNLQAELDAFDLNGDGIFNAEEATPEMEAAMLRVISDTGRTFAPITGGIFCFVYFIVLYLLFMVSFWYRKYSQ